MKYMIYDETDDRFVNESEAYGETEDYGNFDDPCRYHGDLDEAEKEAGNPTTTTPASEPELPF